jgi:hypothetical protein
MMLGRDMPFDVNGRGVRAEVQYLVVVLRIYIGGQRPGGMQEPEATWRPPAEETGIWPGKGSMSEGHSSSRLICVIELGGRREK